MTSALDRAVKASGPDAVLSALSEPETLARTVALVQHMATHYGIDLGAAIEAKMEYNRGRPYRHGGKALWQ